MKPSTIYIISTLSALAAAVNLVGYSQSGCHTGAYVACNNVAQRTCCSMLRIVGGEGMGAVAGLYQNIPGSSLIVGWQKVQHGAICGSVAASHHVGAGSFCDNLDPTVGQFAGLSWQPSSKKRSASNEPLKCTSTAKPDLLVLEDGRKFNLTDMDEKKLDELWVLAFGGARVDSLPDTLLEHRT